MPVIKIKELVQETTAKVNGLSNAVVIPLMVKKVGNTTPTECKYYTYNTKNDFTTDFISGSYNQYDNSYFMINELLNARLDVYVQPVVVDDLYEDLKEALSPIVTKSGDTTPAYTFKDSVKEVDFAKFYETYLSKGYYKKFLDKSLYNFKFLTIGTHPSCYAVTSAQNSKIKNDDSTKIKGAYKTLLELCRTSDDGIKNNSSRGDCIAIIDFEPDTSVQNLLNYVRISDLVGDKTGCCTFPWVKYTYDSNGTPTTTKLSGGFAYLMTFAKSIVSYQDYIAVAGYKRGAVDYTPVETLGEIDMHNLQYDSHYAESTTGAPKVLINPIIKCGDGLYRIWGNRVFNYDSTITRSDESKDCTDFLNVRHLICDIKKQCYAASAACTFEPNDDITWFNFKTIVNPELDKMVSNRGLEWYTWTREKADKKGYLKARLSIKPIEAVESFEITVYVQNSDDNN